MSPTRLCQFIDLAALHKMNRVHLHLTDDQGWRIEIKKYPKLTEVGAWRKETVVGHLSKKPLRFDGKKHGAWSESGTATFYCFGEVHDCAGKPDECICKP